jgi:hypothetical protein
MKKFDRILRETYRIILEQDPNAPIDPNMDPNAAMDPSMGADLGAAAPEPEQPEGVLSPAAEVALTELIYLALYIDPKDVSDAQKDQLENLVPRGADDISPDNTKSVINILRQIIKEENPNIALDSAEKTDAKIIDALPEV